MCRTQTKPLMTSEGTSLQQLGEPTGNRSWLHKSTCSVANIVDGGHVREMQAGKRPELRRAARGECKSLWLLERVDRLRGRNCQLRPEMPHRSAYRRVALHRTAARRPIHARRRIKAPLGRVPVFHPSVQLLGRNRWILSKGVDSLIELTGRNAIETKQLDRSGRSLNVMARFRRHRDSRCSQMKQLAEI